MNRRDFLNVAPVVAFPALASENQTVAQIITDKLASKPLNKDQRTLILKDLVQTVFEGDEEKLYGFLAEKLYNGREGRLQELLGVILEDDEYFRPIEKVDRQHVMVLKGSKINVGFASEKDGVIENWDMILQQDMCVWMEEDLVPAVKEGIAPQSVSPL